MSSSIASRIPHDYSGNKRFSNCPQPRAFRWVHSIGRILCCGWTVLLLVRVRGPSIERLIDQTLAQPYIELNASVDVRDM